MSFLRDYEDDIFISYAHIDNQPLVEGQKGWITSFHQALEIRLGQLLGDRPVFWRDESDLRGNDYFDDAIVIRLPKVAILLTVLTPRYVKSDWCRREVEEFQRLAERTGGLRVADKSRIFKIVKTPVPPEQQPPEMQRLLGYEFFQTDPATGKPREFIFNSGPNVDINYWAKLDDLAYDVFKLLETLKTGAVAARADVRPEAAPGTVYLAETTLDLSVERDKIRRELQSRGYRVVPEQPLPLDAAGIERAVREGLRDSMLSIHLVGANYGVVPEGTERSVARLQNDLAAERCRDGSGFSRVIWLPPGLDAKEPRQREFVTHLCEDSSAQHGAELLQTSVEDLKTVIHDKLAAAARPAAEPAAARDEGPPRVYLVCDSRDSERAAPLADYLFDCGLEVITPLTDCDEAQARADHRENLMLCDAILIYYGEAGEPWLRTKLLDLRKLAGYGRTRPPLVKAVYVGAPATPAKERFRTLEATVIKQPDQFSPDALAPLVARLSDAGGKL